MFTEQNKKAQSLSNAKRKHAGALMMGSFESTPFFLRGAGYVMQARMGGFAPDGIEHSFFCVHELFSGLERLRLPEDARAVEWIFGSACGAAAPALHGTAMSRSCGAPT